MRSEIQEHLSFTPKETDIYKIHQSGDLANLDGLDDESLKLLPSLKKLRDALYSSEFRSYLCNVTGSSFVSGKKTDMAINVYTPGSHLLCHDDVIGSRRISYILYLTDPDDPWQPDWGGALRLYKTEKLHDPSKGTALVPNAEPSKSIPPAFNQLSFFAVQPGESFHDVEEVYAPDKGDCKGSGTSRVRMAISGWYHVPQEGEEGFITGEESSYAERSSLTQLQGTPHIHDLPQSMKTDYAPLSNGEAIESPNELSLSETDLDFLLQYIAPTYLTPDTLESVSDMFSEESSFLLENFLSKTFSEKVRPHLESSEQKNDNREWKTARPPHKHRYLYQHASDDIPSPCQELVRVLVPSPAFQKWLRLATGQVATSHDVLLRRFRRGKDYTLAQSYDASEPRLEVCLSLTPSLGWDADEGDRTNGHVDGTEHPVDPSNAPGDVGGYLTYMAGDNDDGTDDEKSDHGITVPANLSNGGQSAKSHKSKADPAIYRAADDDEDDGVLFSMPACWNKLGIVMRDKGTMRFVKYVSRSARGDRWDLFGECDIQDPGSSDGEDQMTEDSNGSDAHSDGTQDEPTDIDNASDT